MGAFSIYAAIIQILTLAFWVFIIYAAVTLVKNSNENKKRLEGIELELRKINLRLENDSNHG
ncbi:hypothetical protein [Paenibacillus agricola]|uniref:CcmD family protein n=1 Tax=Paenibacillus agricola TaxID=2716264 RepID=A0ABX0J2H9_9BACL|nr:hypothetical protein [Paenibacillus agricola]NHN30347.1 hypothetical protein [Paenibacillus agricola]